MNNMLKIRNTLSPKPYLIRAFYEWMIDNRWTPHIIANAMVSGAQIPEEHIEDNKITLNISPAAVKDLSLGNETIDFYARFSGVVKLIRVPVRAVLAIYARENGRGTVFGEEEEEEEQSSPTDVVSSNNQSVNKGKPALRIVKSESGEEKR